jgi:hypothetical protein
MVGVVASARRDPRRQPSLLVPTAHRSTRARGTRYAFAAAGTGSRPEGAGPLVHCARAAALHVRMDEEEDEPMDESPTLRPRRRDSSVSHRGRDAPDAVQSAGVVVTSVRRPRYVPLSTDSARVAAVLAALYEGFLGADAGPDTWQRTTVLGRLARGIRAEQWAVADLVGRYHFAPQELADQLASIAWDWYRTRPLDEDAAWTAPPHKMTAARLRRLRRHVHGVRDLLRDLSQQVANHFDTRVQESCGRWSTE